MNPAEEAQFARNTDSMFKRMEDIDNYIEENKYDVMYDYLMTIPSEDELDNLFLSDEELFEKHEEDIFEFVSERWEGYYKPERDYDSE